MEPSRRRRRRRKGNALRVTAIVVAALPLIWRSFMTDALAGRPVVRLSG